MTHRQQQRMMAYLAYLLCLACSLAVEAQETWELREDVTVSSDGTAKTIEFDVSGFFEMNESDTLLARSTIVGGPKHVQVSLDALHGGLTTSWHLRNSGFAEAPLCHNPVGVGHTDDRVAVVARMDMGDEDVKIRVELVKTSIRLGFGQNWTSVISPERPLTLLVDPVSDIDASNRDRYILHFGSDGATGNVCTVVSAYAGVCPYKDREDSVRTADMWFTALDRGAMTIRYAKTFIIRKLIVNIKGGGLNYHYAHTFK